MDAFDEQYGGILGTSDPNLSDSLDMKPFMLAHNNVCKIEIVPCVTPTSPQTATGQGDNFNLPKIEPIGTSTSTQTPVHIHTNRLPSIQVFRTWKVPRPQYSTNYTLVRSLLDTHQVPRPQNQSTYYGTNTYHYLGPKQCHQTSRAQNQCSKQCHQTTFAPPTSNKSNTLPPLFKVFPLSPFKQLLIIL